jgi:tetratricopeptide (TPR) repeat protein
MRIPSILIAEYAVAKPDGRFYIVGGGFDKVDAPTFPHTIDRLSLAVRAEIESSDPPGPTTLNVVFTDPQGNELFKRRQVTITLRAAATFPAPVNLVWDYAPVTLRGPGIYTLSVSFQAREVANAQLTANGPTSELEAREAEYSTAFQAYARGDVAKGEQLVRALADKEPGWYLAQNALGFILLAQGKASEALRRFEDARRLGYLQLEILDVNVACCRYLLGDVAGALAGFEECLRTHSITGGSAILTGLNGDEVFTIHVETPQEYLALVGANAAWSALRDRNLDVARRYLQLARTFSDVVKLEPALAISIQAASEGVGDAQ